MYNVVTLRTRWKNSGMLEGLKSGAQEVEAAILYQKTADNLLDRISDGFTDDNMESNIAFSTLYELYRMLNVWELDHAGMSTKNLAPLTVRQLVKKLRNDEHTINWEWIINETISLTDEHPMESIGGTFSIDYTSLMSDWVLENYLLKHGR